MKTALKFPLYIRRMALLLTVLASAGTALSLPAGAQEPPKPPPGTDTCYGAYANLKEAMDVCRDFFRNGWCFSPIEVIGNASGGWCCCRTAVVRPPSDDDALSDEQEPLQSSEE